MLQLKIYKVKSKEEPYIRINTRELNRVPSTKYLSYICLANGPCYTKYNLL